MRETPARPERSVPTDVAPSSPSHAATMNLPAPSSRRTARGSAVFQSRSTWKLYQSRTLPATAASNVPRAVALSAHSPAVMMAPPAQSAPMTVSVRMLSGWLDLRRGREAVQAVSYAVWDAAPSTAGSAVRGKIPADSQSTTVRKGAGCSL